MMVMCMNDRGSGDAPTIRSTRRPTASSATNGRSCRARPRTWIRRSSRRLHSRQTTTIPTALTRMLRRRSAKWMATELDRGFSAGGSSHPITIHALGDQTVNNYGYSGPSIDDGSVQSKDGHPSLWLRRYARLWKCHHRRSNRDCYQLERRPRLWSLCRQPATARCRCAPSNSRAADTVGKRCTLRRTGHHGGQWQEIGRRRDRHGRRQGSNSRRLPAGQRSKLRSTKRHRAT